MSIFSSVEQGTPSSTLRHSSQHHITQWIFIVFKSIPQLQTFSWVLRATLPLCRRMSTMDSWPVVVAIIKAVSPSWEWEEETMDWVCRLHTVCQCDYSFHYILTVYTYTWWKCVAAVWLCKSGGRPVDSQRLLYSIHLWVGSAHCANTLHCMWVYAMRHTL